MNDRDLELREKSGGISTTDPLAVLFYVLAKDYLTASQLEEILEKIRNTMPGTVLFNNGWLGKYAIELKGQIDKLRHENTIDGQVSTATKSPETDDIAEVELALNSLKGTMSADEVERIRKDIEDFEETNIIEKASDE